MPSVLLPRRESLLPPPYSDGPVDLVAIGRRLGRAEPDDLEFAETPLRFATRAAAVALIPIAAGALAWITLWDAHSPLEVPTALTVLTFVTLAALVAHVLGHVRPRWRPNIERAVWLGAALLRTVCLVVTLALFALFVVFAALKWVDPDFWAEVVEPLEWQLFAWSATAAVIATLLSLRRPLLRIDPRWSWVHAVSTPVPSIVTTCLGLLVLSLITLIPDDVDTVHETTAVFSSLASVAAVIAAVVAAWASIGVGAAQHVRSIRHGIAQSFLEVAGAARAARPHATATATPTRPGTTSSSPRSTACSTTCATSPASGCSHPCRPMTASCSCWRGSRPGCSGSRSGPRRAATPDRWIATSGIPPSTVSSPDSRRSHASSPSELERTSFRHHANSRRHLP